MLDVARKFGNTQPGIDFLSFSVAEALNHANKIIGIGVSSNVITRGVNPGEQKQQRLNEEKISPGGWNLQSREEGGQRLVPASADAENTSCLISRD